MISNALTDEQFKGKGDSDIFGSIVKPEDLVNPQQATITMPGGRVETGNIDGVEKSIYAEKSKYQNLKRSNKKWHTHYKKDIQA